MFHNIKKTLKQDSWLKWLTSQLATPSAARCLVGGTMDRSPTKRRGVGHVRSRVPPILMRSSPALQGPITFCERWVIIMGHVMRNCPHSGIAYSLSSSWEDLTFCVLPLTRRPRIMTGIVSLRGSFQIINALL